MAELSVSIVAVDRQVWSGAATMVVAKTVEGEIGILAGHEPVLAVLANGVVRVEPVEGEKLVFAVHGGFFAVDQNIVTILAESAESAAEIDLARAEAALARAKASGLDTPEELAAIHRAETRVKVASGHLRG